MNVEFVKQVVSSYDVVCNTCHCGQLCVEVDGYYYYWPTTRGGFVDAHFLRQIADKLDELNKDWDAQVQADLSIRSPL